MSAVEQPLPSLPVLAEKERQALLRDSRGPVFEQALDPAFNVVTQFELRAVATPEASACYAGTRSISYGDLNARANRLAHHLIKLGVESEVVVGVYLERSIETLIALLAIFKAGGAYVPLDVNYPQHYLELMINNAGLSHILCNNVLNKTRPPVTATILNIATLADVLATQSSENPGVKLMPEQLAYILYTSGSTGTPKGVEVPHAQVTNCLQNYCIQYPLDSNERVAQRTTTAFAVSVKELFAALVSGASVVILADDLSKDPARLAAAIRDYGVTRLSIVPSHLEAMLASGAEVSTSLRSLRYCITAGEPLPKSVADRVRQLLPATRLLNNYGCTECNDIAYQDVFALDGNYQFVPVGFPISNTEVYVLDTKLQPVPIGVPGELCVAGQSVPRGYRGRPDLTAEKFIEHPFSPGKRLFKTGDYVKRLASGAIEYIGRQDLQVKVRGSRVDARQVEYVMSLYPGVTTPIASHSPAGDQLVGYFTEKPESPVGRVQLKRYLSDQLPGYMVPDILVRLDNLPRLPNGKVDRRNLPSPTKYLSDNEQVIAPETETEKTVALIWAKLLNTPVKNIGRDSNFFDLGGHSLGAIRLLAALKSEFLFEISLKDFFDSSDLKHLSESIDKRIALVISIIELLDQQ